MSDGLIVESGDVKGPRASHVDRTSPLPLYYQLKQWLSAQMATGALGPGAQLPGEHELCTRFAVSRGVVRQALSELRYEGLIDRERGRGTFVTRPKTLEGLMSGVGGLADDVAGRHELLESTILLFREVPATDAVARSLAVELGDPVIELERLRTIEGEPRVLVLTYLPAALVPGLLDKALTGTASLYRILREDYGLPILSSVRRVEAAIADSREAGLLQIRRGDPLLVLRSVGFTTGNTPFDYFVAHHRGDRSAFEVILSDVPAGASRFKSLNLTPKSANP